MFPLRASLFILNFALLPTSFTVALRGTNTNEVESQAYFVPKRVTYETIRDDGSSVSASEGEENSLLFEALCDVGLVSITQIPGFSVIKKEVMRSLHDCLVNQNDDDTNDDKTYIYQDGTVRRTLSSITFPGPGGSQPISIPSNERNTLACHRFAEKSKAFRALIGDVTAAFARRLTTEMKSMLQSPLMSTKNEEHIFPFLEDVVNEGHHLEHFHSYQKIIMNTKSGSSDSSLQQRQGQKPLNAATIDMHTDQGFFIAFTPGVLVQKRQAAVHSSSDEIAEKIDYTLSDGFYIEMPNGSRSLVSFDLSDHLVFMMGDGVNQYVNPKLVRGKSNRVLRATPHALHMSSQSIDTSRLWYGRMILPPPGAYSFQYGMTYGEIRSRLLEASSSSPDQMKGQSSSLHLGCSSSNMLARQLEDVTCAANSTYCWHRCMSWAEAGISQEQCDALGLRIQCVNPRDQRWDLKHGDFFPACSNTTKDVTPFTSLPTYPRDDKSCSASEWEKFSSHTGYDHVFDLSVANQTSAKFMWTVHPTNETIVSRLAFNGLFGFLAFGLASSDPNAGHNGMNGASIVLALPGGNYSAQVGLDLTQPSSLQEYKISSDEAQSSFRFWSNSLSDNLLQSAKSGASIVNTSCFTAITFQSNKINDRSFNISGVDVLLWAGGGVDSFVSYHGMNRAKFSVNWLTGEAAFGKTYNFTKPSTKTSGATTTRVVYSWGTFLSLAAVVPMLFIATW